MSIRYSEARVPTAVGAFRLRVYEDAHNCGAVAIVGGEPLTQTPVLTRLHAACFLAETLGYVGCDCRQRLSFALEAIARCGGVVVYLRRDARGVRLREQLRSVAETRSTHALVEHGLLDDASFPIAAAILRDLGIAAVRLIDAHHGEAAALAAVGVNVTGEVVLGAPPQLRLTALAAIEKVLARAPLPPRSAHAAAAYRDVVDSGVRRD